jgi:hypothetical protein
LEADYAEAVDAAFQERTEGTLDHRMSNGPPVGGQSRFKQIFLQMV